MSVMVDSVECELVSPPPPALVIAITCPDGRPFSCTTDKCSCLITSSSQATFVSANSMCEDDGGDGSLILIMSERDDELLQRYLEVLGESGNTYWVGYRYNATGDLEDVNGEPPPDVITDNTDDAGVVAANGVCLAARLNGTFTNVNCTVEMDYVCFVQYPGMCVYVCVCDSTNLVLRDCSCTCIQYCLIIAVLACSL